MRVSIELSELEVVLLRRITDAIDSDGATEVSPESSIEEISSQLGPAHIEILSVLYESGAVSEQTKKSRREMNLNVPKYAIQKTLVDLGLIDNEPRRRGLCLTAKGLKVIEDC